jgi:hypothetical protein
VNDHLDEQITERASASYEAIRALNHDTINQLNMTPSGVSSTVMNLAAMAAALPQACAQLSRILARANDDQVLTMDSLVDETDAWMAIGQAEIHLDEARELAVELYKHLDAAHQATAHIVSNGPKVVEP